MRKFLRVALRATGLVALVAGASTSASATMVAAVCQDLTCSNSPVIVTDNLAGDTIPAPGAINFSVAAFGYSLVVNTAQSKPEIGSATFPQLDLNFTATGTGTIFLFVGDTDFTGVDPFLLALGQTSSGGGNSSVTGRAWGESTDNALTFSPLLGSIALSGVASAGTFSGMLAPSLNPYSLGLGVQITRDSAGTTTGDLNLQAVPEPATWGLMLLGFAGIGMAMRRTRRNTRPAQIA